MRIGNARRIAWFIQLQRLLQFQKSVFAPRAVRASRNRSMGNEVSAGRSAAGGLLETPVLAAVLPRNVVPEYVWSKTSNESFADRGTDLRAGATSVEIMLKLLRHVQTRAFSGDRSSTISRSLAAKHLPQSRRSESGYGDASRTKLPVTSVAAVPTRATRGHSVSADFAQPSNTWVSLLTATRSASASTRLEESLRAPPPLVGEEGSSRLVPDDNGQSWSSGRNGSSTQDAGESKARGRATVHLDGSALGRWAIQHLERTLGKPATGMTGVDPRASLPRGRVAPF